MAPPICRLIADGSGHPCCMKHLNMQPIRQDTQTVETAWDVKESINNQLSTSQPQPVFQAAFFSVHASLTLYGLILGLLRLSNTQQA